MSSVKNKIKTTALEVRKYFLAKHPALTRLFYRKFWKPKPGSLDAEIDRFSKATPKLTFIQVGSNDGFQNDPLYKFIKRDKWHGLLIEPQKAAFETLQYIYQKDDVNPINKAIAETSESKKLYKIAFTNARWASGISSFIYEHVKEKVDSGYVDEKCRKYGLTPPSNKEDYIDSTDVVCTTFNSLLTEHQLDQVDLLQVDTEGFDFEILKMFDFEKYRPGMVVYEHEGLSHADQQACLNYLQNFGYATKTVGRDVVAYI